MEHLIRPPERQHLLQRGVIGNEPLEIRLDSTRRSALPLERCPRINLSRNILMTCLAIPTCRQVVSINPPCHAPTAPLDIAFPKQRAVDASTFGFGGLSIQRERIPRCENRLQGAIRTLYLSRVRIPVQNVPHQLALLSREVAKGRPARDIRMTPMLVSDLKDGMFGRQVLNAFQMRFLDRLHRSRTVQNSLNISVIARHAATSCARCIWRNSCQPSGSQAASSQRKMRPLSS